MAKPPRLPDDRRNTGDTRPHGWPQYERAERQARVFGAMLDRFGTSEETRRSGLAGIIAAGENCLSCRHTIACEAWIAAGVNSAAPTFCPGAAVFGHRDIEEPVG